MPTDAQRAPVLKIRQRNGHTDARSRRHGLSGKLSLARRYGMARHTRRVRRGHHRKLGLRARRDGFGRRTLVLALGLLGRVVEWDEAVPNPERADDTSAWVLGTVLADPVAARDRVREADRRARSGARKITDTALLRLRAGYGYSVVER